MPTEGMANMSQGPWARCLGAALLPTLTSPCPFSGGGHVEEVQETKASQLAVRQELLPQTNWLLKSFSKMEFSASGNNGVCAGRDKQEGNNHPPSPRTGLGREHSQDSQWGGGARRGHPQGRTWEGKR